MNCRPKIHLHTNRWEKVVPSLRPPPPTSRNAACSSKKVTKVRLAAINRFARLSLAQNRTLRYVRSNFASGVFFAKNAARVRRRYAAHAQAESAARTAARGAFSHAQAARGLPTHARPQVQAVWCLPTHAAWGSRSHAQAPRAARRRYKCIDHIPRVMPCSHSARAREPGPGSATNSQWLK